MGASEPFEIIFRSARQGRLMVRPRAVCYYFHLELSLNISQHAKVALILLFCGRNESVMVH
jgi:hypothetical protein